MMENDCLKTKHGVPVYGDGIRGHAVSTIILLVRSRRYDPQLADFGVQVLDRL